MFLLRPEDDSGNEQALPEDEDDAGEVPEVEEEEEDLFASEHSEPDQEQLPYVAYDGHFPDLDNDGLEVDLASGPLVDDIIFETDEEEDLSDTEAPVDVPHQPGSTFTYHRYAFQRLAAVRTSLQIVLRCYCDDYMCMCTQSLCVSSSHCN